MLVARDDPLRQPVVPVDDLVAVGVADSRELHGVARLALRRSLVTRLPARPAGHELPRHLYDARVVHGAEVVAADPDAGARQVAVRRLQDVLVAELAEEPPDGAGRRAVRPPPGWRARSRSPEPGGVLPSAEEVLPAEQDPLEGDLDLALPPDNCG